MQIFIIMFQILYDYHQTMQEQKFIKNLQFVNTLSL